jgi:hypothetical protein
MLLAARSRFEPVGGRRVSRILLDPLIAEALIFQHRDREALAVLGVPARRVSGTAARVGLLLARNGRVAESLSLNPTRNALRYLSGYEEDAVKALPQLQSVRGLVATWCLAIAQDEFVGRHPEIAELYYKMGLDAQPGQPLISLCYGVFLRAQNRCAEAVPLVETGAKRLTGMLRVSAETELREINSVAAGGERDGGPNWGNLADQQQRRRQERGPSQLPGAPGMDLCLREPALNS